MLEQLLSEIEELERQKEAHLAVVGSRLLALGQIESQKTLLRQMIAAEQQRQEAERQRQNEPSAAV